MDDTSMRWQCEWLANVQGVTTTPDVLAEAVRVVAQIGMMASQAAAALPADTEPVSATTHLERLAAWSSKHG